MIDWKEINKKTFEDKEQSSLEMKDVFLKTSFTWFWTLLIVWGLVGFVVILFFVFNALLVYNMCT